MSDTPEPSAPEPDPELPEVTEAEREPLRQAQESIDEARSAAADAVVSESSRGDLDLPDPEESVPAAAEPDDRDH